MNRDAVPNKKGPLFFLFALTFFTFFLPPQVAISENDLLMEIIIAHNKKSLEESYLKGTNKG